jgi:gas vesicle protein
MARGKCKTISNRSQYICASSEHSSPTTASSEYTNTPENQEVDLKFYLLRIIESFKEDINNSLKEIQENTGKQLEALKEETKPLKEIQGKKIKQVKELYKVVQDLKVEVEQ